MQVLGPSGSAYGGRGSAPAPAPRTGSAAPALTWGGKALAAAGTLYAAAQEAGSLRRQARAKEQELEAARVQGFWEEIRANEENRRLLSSQRQLFGQAGVMLEGSPSLLLRQGRTEYVLDRMTHARNLRSQVQALRADAEELRRAGRSAWRSGVLGAFSQLF